MLSTYNRLAYSHLIAKFCVYGFTLEVIEKQYAAPGRYYHNIDHIEFMTNKALGPQYNFESHPILFLAILFHDYFYDIKSSENEQKSADFARVNIKHKFLGNAVAEAILHEGNWGKVLDEFDYAIFEQDSSLVLDYDRKIFKEYQQFSWEKYKEGRTKFLQSSYDRYKYLDGTIAAGMLLLINHYKTWKPNIGLVAGSFNPFHAGHLNVLQKAEQIFDKVIVAQGRNINKERPESIFGVNELDFRQKIEYSGLITDVLEENGNPVLIRGLRSVTDVPAEMAFLRHLQDIKPDVRVAHIFCDSQFEHVSSSAIRELKNYAGGHENKYIVK